MLLTILFILGSSVHRGTYNSSIFNAVLSIRSVISILWSNLFISILSFFGKIGYFPISLLFSPLPHSPSHRSSIPDSINKLSHFGSFLLIVHHSISNNSFSHIASTLNVFIILFLIKLLQSIKQIILISSILNYLFIIALLWIDEYLFTSYFLIIYYFFTIMILAFYFSYSMYWILFYLPDPIHCKVLIVMLVIVFILFWSIQYSSYPTFMWSNKLFSLLSPGNQSVSIAYNFTFYSIVIYQLYFIRFMSLSIPYSAIELVNNGILQDPYSILGIDSILCNRRIAVEWLDREKSKL